tara:strand:+ start:72063 stop:72446 length:384 start_codon:yes stop_codon:yes gene_type:complete
MALTRTNRLLAVGGSILVLVVMMMATVDPQTQYFVDEVMDNPNDFEGHIHIRGEIANNSIDSENYTFVLMGIDHELFVDFSGTAVPDGFNEGKTIAVKGLLIYDSGYWILEAKEIQTGCPSKYVSAE